MAVIDLTTYEAGGPSPELEPDTASRLAVNSLANFAWLNKGYSQGEVSQEELIVDHTREQARQRKTVETYYREVGSGAVKTMYTVDTFFYGHAFPISTI